MKCSLIKLEAQWPEPVSLTFHSAMRKLYTEPSMVLPTKFRFIWRSSFKEEYIQKQELPVVAMFDNGSELNEQSYRGPSIDASYQVSVHLARRFQRRRFF